MGAGSSNPFLVTLVVVYGSLESKGKGFGFPPSSFQPDSCLSIFSWPRLNVKPNIEAPTLQNPQDILLLLCVPSRCPHFLHGKHGFSQNFRGIHSDIRFVCDEYLISCFLTMQSVTQLSFSSFLRWYHVLRNTIIFFALIISLGSHNWKSQKENALLQRLIPQAKPKQGNLAFMRLSGQARLLRFDHAF